MFKILRSLKEEGKTIVLITHKLNEIMDLTSAVSVMRQGEVVGHTKTENTNREKLAEMMVGRSVLLRINKSKVEKGDVVFNVENLTVKDNSHNQEYDLAGYEYNQSTMQSFYYVKEVPMAELGDWIIAYNDDVVVGTREWAGSMTDVPVMGYDGDEYCLCYIQQDDCPEFG